jgi:molybdenum cofactor biosynthesis protein A
MKEEIVMAQLVDKFGRTHNYLRISLTEKCNLRCFYCMPEEGVPFRDKSNFMTKEEVLGIAGIFNELGVQKIRLTGGEPLVCKDAGHIMKKLGELPVELAITSNGILVDKFIPVFKESGLKHINISLDSLKREKQLKITRRDYYDKIMENISLVEQEDFILKVNVVLVKGVNDEEVLDFIRWGRDKAINIRFIEFMPFNGNNWDWSKGVSEIEIIEQAKAIYGSDLIRIADSQNDTSRNYKINGFKGSFAIISSVTNPFCGTCNRIRLTSDGKIKNCLFSQSETNLLSPYRNGEDIRPLILESIWDKKAARGGMETFEDFSNSDINSKNRSMIAIGG